MEISDIMEEMYDFAPDPHLSRKIGLYILALVVSIILGWVIASTLT